MYKPPLFLLLMSAVLSAAVTTVGLLDFSYSGDDNSKRWIGSMLAQGFDECLMAQDGFCITPDRQMRIHRTSHKKGNKPADIYAFGNLLNLDFLVSAEYEAQGDTVAVSLKVWNVRRQKVEILSLSGAESRLLPLSTKLCAAFVNTVQAGAPFTEPSLRLPAERVFAVYAMGIDHFANNRFSEALFAAERAVALDPAYPAPLLLLARIHMQGGETGKALAFAKKALKLLPDNCEALSIYGLALAADGNSEKALTFLKGYKSRCADAYEYNHALGLAFLEEGYYTVAVSYFVKAIRFNPGITELSYLLGRAQLGAEDYGKAIKNFERAVTLEPSNPLYRCMLGMACRDGGDLIRAVQVLEGLLVENPDYLPAVFHLSSCYNLLGWYKKALQVLNSAYARHPGSADLLAGFAVAHMKSGDKALADDFFRKALKADNHSPVVLNNYGVFMLERRQYDDAVPLLFRALKYDKRNPGIAYNLALGYFRLNKISPAEKYLDVTLESSPSHLGARKLLVELYKAQGQPEKALTALSEIITLDNSDYDAKTEYAQILIRLGEKEQAVTVLEDVVKNNPGNNEYLHLLIEAYKVLQWWDIAILKLDNLLAKNPKNGLILAQLGEITYRKSLITAKGADELALKALFYLKQSVTLEPNRGEALFWYARASFDFKNDKVTARELFAQCLKMPLSPVLIREAEGYLKKK